MIFLSPIHLQHTLVHFNVLMCLVIDLRQLLLKLQYQRDTQWNKGEKQQLIAQQEVDHDLRYNGTKMVYPCLYRYPQKYV